MLVDPGVGTQLLRQHLGHHVAGGVVVMNRSWMGMAWKTLEVELAVGAAYELGTPRLEVPHHIGYAIYPGARQFRVDELTSVFQDVLQVQLRTVVASHRRGEAAARDGGRSTGRTAFCDLNHR